MNGPLHGPWPKVAVNGRLESAETEWLHTNGAGAYAMSTVAMRHTRRYHGVLIAALKPPVDRYVASVSHLETDLLVGERSYRLSTLQSPDAAPTPGYRFLETFEQDPVPRWTYRVGKVKLEQRLSLVRGQNAVVVTYTWHGASPVAIRVRPLMPMRRIHTLMREHEGMVQRIRMNPGLVEIRPVPALPRVLFSHPGVFVGSPDWHRRLEYPEDKLRGVEGEEDLWTPGSFELELRPGQPAYLVIAVGELPLGKPQDNAARTTAFLREQDPGNECPRSIRELSIFAEQFCADECEHASVVAGYPWLTALSRDQLIALPGLYLVRGKLDGARRVLGTLIRAMSDDLVPRRVRKAGEGEDPPSPDATLWLFEAVRLLVSVVGHADPFVRDTLYPALIRVFRRVSQPGKPVLSVAPSGLVVSGDEEVALTWIDSQTGAPAASLRRGFAVELQALWSKGCETLANLAREYGDAPVAEAAREACQKTRAEFAKRFWCDETRYPYDCIRGAEDAAGLIADASIRPNALVALDVDPDLFERWQATSIVERVRDRLLTDRGVRSLDPDQPGYRGEYEGSLADRTLAYHQGLAWTHLLGAYARSSLRLSPDDFELEESLRVRVEAARVGGPVLGQVSQFADGEAPYLPGGCPAQATSVAELLRTLSWDLKL